jgi:ubiquinone/menaquinone biosynthesis C-methylase UbiE
MKSDSSKKESMVTMRKNNHGDLCRYSPFKGWMLDNGIRRLFQDPKKIVGSYVKEGMTVIDIGCGPGMFTLAMAKMVGETGKVIAVDVQHEMLDVVRTKSEQKGLVSRIRFHRAEPERLGVGEKADFILSFYMVHEVPDRDRFLKEVRMLLKPGAKYLIVEPDFHVSKEAFKDTVDAARRVGLKPVFYPKVLWSRAALFTLE